MKKSTLALSVAAAIGSFGLVGNAFAIGELGVGTISPSSILAATALNRNPDGIGHQLIVPYYSVQANNTTLLNIANTDGTNAKVVKVRFRGAANSDDVFDFQLLLSPGDIWAAGLTQDAKTGVAKLKVYDATCTLPLSVKENKTYSGPTTVIESDGSLFVTNRVDPTPASGDVANQTREGYVEIINMADIPPTAYNAATSDIARLSTLWGTVKHVNKVAPCDEKVLKAALSTDYATVAAANTAVGPLTITNGYAITAPTGGLTADWVIMNQTNTAAWSGSAAAFQAESSTGVRGAGNLVFWPQADNVTMGSAPLLASNAAQRALRLATADPIFVTGVKGIQHYDLPDLSTPYVTADSTAGVRAAAHRRIDDLARKLAVTSITNQYVTKEISGVTDFLFSQPTRRYAVGVNYTAEALTGVGAYSQNGTKAAPILRNGTEYASVGVAVSSTVNDYALNIYNGVGSPYYIMAVNSSNGQSTGNLAMGSSTKTARQVCLGGVSTSYTDREESLPEFAFQISPGGTSSFLLCGEAAIASVNGGGDTFASALNASVVRNDIMGSYDVGSVTFGTAGPTYTAKSYALTDTDDILSTGVDGLSGSVVISNGTTAVATGAGGLGLTGLPILSGTFIRVANGAVNYGFSIPSKVTRTAGY